MKGFCQHCGRELNGDEPYCPECGSPTRSVPQPAYGTPPKNRTNMWIIIIAVLAAISILAIAVVPILLEDRDTYKVTINVDEFSIELADLQQYEGASTKSDVILKFSFYNGSTLVEKELTLYKNYQLNSSVKNPNFDTGITFSHFGNPEGMSYAAYLYIQRTNIYDHRPQTTLDNIDLFSVDKTKITGDSSYFGCTGVAFDTNDIVNNSVELRGDSDPIGYVKLTVTWVKN